MLIAKETALSIVQEMKAAAGYDINLMDDTGRILASTDPARMGQVHAGAKALLEQGLDRLVVHEDAPQQGTRRGINLPIRMDGRAVGVIGITGAPEQVEALGGVIQHMTEILLRDARRQEQETLLEDARQCFIESWLFPRRAICQSWSCGDSCWASTLPGRGRRPFWKYAARGRAVQAGSFATPEP